MRGAFSIYRTSEGTEIQKCHFVPSARHTPNGDLSCNGMRPGPYFSGVRPGFFYKLLHRVCIVFDNEEHQVSRKKLQFLLQKLPSYIPRKSFQKNKNSSFKIRSSPAPWAPFSPSFSPSFLGPPGLPPLPKQQQPPQRFRPPRAPRQAPRPAPQHDANFVTLVANLNAFLTANSQKTPALHNERQQNIREKLARPLSFIFANVGGKLRSRLGTGAPPPIGH